ncbi:hypothetical protein CLHUN_14610 [Ruminiclostridium hungatei]|uniref:Bacterial Ig domain-containing protein n=1 Tax=Ruminiclostridium hungatei TaxID=48256 RepID=A0A1V4SKP9_RUMHU|nr:hypothetical protein [Ruminiclostridium hungatei]OPX44468.1 hypothetical protein CLHUN_14610 [Ruminiclostridium hungatei]
MKRVKKFLTVMLVFAMVIGVFPTMSASAATKTIKDYVETSNDGVVHLGMNNKKLEDYALEDGKPFMSGDVEEHGESDLVKVTFKEDGFFFLGGSVTSNSVNLSTGYAYIYANASKSNVLWKSEIMRKKGGWELGGIPVNKGESIYISCYGQTGFGNPTKYNFYASFTPASYIAKPTKATVNKDGTVDLHISNVLKDSIGMRVRYAVGAVDTLRVARNEVKFFQTDREEEPGSIITLPKAGTYTLYVSCNFLNNAYTDCVLIVNTNDYIPKTTPKPAAPVAMYAGTKVVIGVAEPGATVAVKYNNKTVNVTADKKTGLYIAKIATALKKGASVDVVQTVNGIKSISCTVKVTE